MTSLRTKEINRKKRRKWLSNPDNREKDRKAARERMRKKAALKKAIELFGPKE